MEKFIENFAGLFEETDPSTITANTKFHELEEWDSLTALSTIAMIDECYNVKIKGDEIKESVTVENLFNIVNSKI